MYEYAEPNRLHRGISYADEGRVQTVRFHPYGVSGDVAGSRTNAYQVEIFIPGPADDRHLAVLRTLLSDENVRESVLDGLVPRVPRKDEVMSTCSCPDWEEPCKHVIAVWEVVARLIEDSPELLLDILAGTLDGQVLIGSEIRVEKSDPRLYWGRTEDELPPTEVRPRSRMPGWVLYPPAAWPDHLEPYPGIMYDIYERMHQGARRILERSAERE